MAKGNVGAYANVNFKPERLNKYSSEAQSRVSSILRQEVANKRAEAREAAKAYQEKNNKFMSELSSYSKDANALIGDMDKSGFKNATKIRDYRMEEAKSYAASGDFDKARIVLMSMDKDLESIGNIAENFSKASEAAVDPTKAMVKANSIGFADNAKKMNEWASLDFKDGKFYAKGKDGEDLEVGLSYFAGVQTDFNTLDDNWEDELAKSVEDMLPSIATETIFAGQEDRDGVPVNINETRAKSGEWNKQYEASRSALETELVNDKVKFLQVVGGAEDVDEALNEYLDRRARIIANKRVKASSKKESVAFQKGTSERTLNDEINDFPDAFSDVVGGDNLTMIKGGKINIPGSDNYEMTVQDAFIDIVDGKKVFSIIGKNGTRVDLDAYSDDENTRKSAANVISKAMMSSREAGFSKMSFRNIPDDMQGELVKSMNNANISPEDIVIPEKLYFQVNDDGAISGKMKNKRSDMIKGIKKRYGSVIKSAKENFRLGTGIIIEYVDANGDSQTKTVDVPKNQPSEELKELLVELNEIALHRGDDAIGDVDKGNGKKVRDDGLTVEEAAVFNLD